MTASIVTLGFKETQRYIEGLPLVFEKAAALAINDTTARTAMPEARREIYKQVAFPAGYLEEGRLTIKRKATARSLEAVIAGRDRATSLARFAMGATAATSRNRGVNVMIDPGRKVHLKKAFIVNLRNGNRGVAVRLGKGETLKNSQGAQRLFENVYLLYGPSVDQVFRGVSNDIAPAVKQALGVNFFRQFARLTRG